MPHKLNLNLTPAQAAALKDLIKSGTWAYMGGKLYRGCTKQNMKNSLWKQATPYDQLTVIRASLQGHLENWQAGIIDNEKFSSYAAEHLEQIAQLESFLKGQQW